jgi:hypothetical protein
MMSEEESGCTSTSASLAPVLVHEGFDDLDDFVLLRAGETSDVLEGALGFADEARTAIGKGRDAEELLDGTTEDLGKLGHDI